MLYLVNKSQPTGDAGDRQLGGVIIPKAE